MIQGHGGSLRPGMAWGHQTTCREEGARKGNLSLQCHPVTARPGGDLRQVQEPPTLLFIHLGNRAGRQTWKLIWFVVQKEYQGSGLSLECGPHPTGHLQGPPPPGSVSLLIVKDLLLTCQAPQSTSGKRIVEKWHAQSHP